MSLEYLNMLGMHLKAKAGSSICDSVDGLHLGAVEGVVAELEVLRQGVAQTLELLGGGGTDVEGELTSLLLGKSHSLGTVRLEGSGMHTCNLLGSHLTGSRGSVDLSADLVGLLAVVRLLLDVTVLAPGLLDGIDTLELSLAELLLHGDNLLGALLEGLQSRLDRTGAWYTRWVGWRL